MARLVSVNIGRPRANPWRDAPTTGIDKRPVAGPVMVTPAGPKGTGSVGLAGDRAHDVKHHGGTDQAVYAYAREDLDAWAAELGRELPDGVFGENLTTYGMDITGALIGERWRVGAEVLLEVSRPRIPCTTFAGWIGEPDWIKRFTRRAVPGTYLRVIESGQIQAGDACHTRYRPDHDVTVGVAFRAMTTEPDLLPRLLAAAALPEDIKDRARLRTGR